MRDHLRPYRAIREARSQAYPGELHGRGPRHWTTLAALRSGIVASQSPQVPQVAAKVPHGTQPASRVKRLARWLDHARLVEEGSFVPYAELLLAQGA